MNKKFGGIKELNGKPGAVFIVDLPNEMNALREARQLNIPVIAMVDTNADPTLVDYVIPCNDDAIKTISLVADYVKQAIELGKSGRKKSADVDVEAAAGKTGEAEAKEAKPKAAKAEKADK
jgi:small subunit ribosomal protein S2